MPSPEHDVRDGTSGARETRNGRPEASDDVLSAIRAYIATDLLKQPGAEVPTNADLIRQGILTSLQTVELVMFLEERFETEIAPEEVDEENFTSLATIAALVERKLANRGVQA